MNYLERNIAASIIKEIRHSSQNVRKSNFFSALVMCICLSLCFWMMLFVGCSQAHAEHIKFENAYKSIIGEAENQGPKGMLAVACAIRNRGTLKGVYGQNNRRVIKNMYSQSIEQMAQDAWYLSENPNTCSFIKGADHWENIKSFGNPYWSKNMIKTYEYKDHTFYKSKKQLKNINLDKLK